MPEFLNVVDENDTIIGPQSRQVIHEQGLLHREIHVYFITPDKKMIFQHRAKDKDTYPNLLDATVGGHVEIGDDYETTAIKEAFEETGVLIDKSELILLEKTRKCAKDLVNHKTNNAFRILYLYIYRGDIKNLKIEKGDSLGFEAYTLEELLNLDEENKKRFIPYALSIFTELIPKFIKNLK